MQQEEMTNTEETGDNAQSAEEKATLLFGDNSEGEGETDNDKSDDEKSDTNEGSTSDEKDEDDTSGDDKTEEDETDEDDKGAPEKYEDFIIPEGMTLEGEKLTNFQALAKDLNLSQAQAQKLLNHGGDVMMDAANDQRTALAETVKEWEAASKADKEFGGAKLDENLATAKRALDTYGSETFSELLRTTGLGNHPEVIRTFFRVGKTISEDKVLSDGGDGEKPKSQADILFGT